MASWWRTHPEIVVVLAGVSAALHVGKLSPALPALQQVMGMSLLQAGFLLSLVHLAGVLFGLAVAHLAGGWQWTWCVTGLLAALGLFISLLLAREVRR